MALIAAERVKFLSTRSPWWCAAVALASFVGLAALITGTNDVPAQLTVPHTQFGYMFGLLVVLVMAALSVTTEYRFGTIRTTFQAAPGRTAALLAKTVVVTVVAVVLGAVGSFGSWAVGRLISPQADLALRTGADWRAVAGVGLVLGAAAVLAVAVGILIRHSAGALSVLLIYATLVENLVLLIPNVGDDIHRWLPFANAEHFLGQAKSAGAAAPTLSPWLSLAYFAGIAVVALAAALAVAKRRDA